MKYEIKGAPLPVVICTLNAGESVVTEKGGMSWMSPNMRMETNAGGSVGKALSRFFSGEVLFQNVYTAENGGGLIAFASSFPGDILPVDVSKTSIVAQKHSFLASERSVDMSIFFQKRFSSGLFGGEGFVMQKFSGNGIVFLEIDGSLVNYDLKSGETIIIDTGCLAAMEITASISVEAVKGIGNMIFGGEGIFNTRVTGPGKVWLQTMPANSMASALLPYMPVKSK